MKKAISLVLVLLMVFALAACGNGTSSAGNTNENTPATTNPGSGNSAGTGSALEGNPGENTNSVDGAEATVEKSDAVVHMANDGDVGSWSPYGTEGVRQNFLRPIYETLGHMTSAPGLVMQYVLAKEVNQVSDGVYDVTIYDYIHDTEGNHMTADDVVFSFEKYREAGVNLNYISSLKTIEAVNDYTVRMTLENERAGAMDTMFESVRIITKAAYEASGDGMTENPVGTGGYKLAKYEPGSYAQLVRNEDYWQTDESLVAFMSMSNAAEVYIDVTPDASAQTIALQSGDLNSSGYIKAQDLVNFVNDDLSAKPGYSVGVGLTSKMYTLIFNCSDNSLCSDINLRKAIASCLDRTQLAEKAWGLIGVASEAVISEYAKDYPTGFESRYKYDVEQAKAYLADSGYKGETLKLLVYNDLNSDTATLFQAYCLAAGINIELLQYDKAMYSSMSLDNTGTQYDMELAAPFCTGSAWDPMSIYNAENYENGMPHICINDDRLQELYMEMAMAATNSPETTRAFCDYVDEMCYGYGIGTYWKLGICTDNFETVVLSQTGNLVPGACTYR